jgi:hypothetical protein
MGCGQPERLWKTSAQLAAALLDELAGADFEPEVDEPEVDEPEDDEPDEDEFAPGELEEPEEDESDAAVDEPDVEPLSLDFSGCHCGRNRNP